MFTAVTAPDVQAGSEHVAASPSGNPRKTNRRCSCLRCNPANGSPYFRCIRFAKSAKHIDNEPKPDGLEDLLDDDAVINASLLSKQEKALVWGYIQRFEPSMVRFLKDEAVAQLIKAGASPLFQTALVEKALGYRPQ